MRFGVLGPPAVWTDDGTPVPVPEAKVRALLADLLRHEGRLVPADRLIEDLWGGERLPRNPAATLQSRVSQLRRVLEAAEPGGRDLVVWEPPGYRLVLSPGAVDADRFRALVARARDTAEPRARAALFGDALALWRGPAYAGFADREFARTAAARLDDERIVVMEDQARARLEFGENRTLAGELGDLVARHPLCERLRAVHLRALYQAGRQSEALAAYEETRVMLAEELGVDPSPELAALHRAILRQDPELTAPDPDPAPDAAGPAPPRPAGRRPALPAPLTALTGRAGDLAALRALLTADGATARLVTLTGPGGVGKTALALQAAREAGAAFPDGVWPVELAELDRAAASAAAVARLVARALGVPDGPGDPLDRLAAALAPRRLLLLLDTCEHVVEPVAEVAEALLRAVPGLRVLATGREPLALPGERLWAVPPLPVPPEGAGAAEAGTFDAVRLFVERAAAAAPGFRLGPDNAAAVVAVCRRLEGLPLALELAAARVRVLGVAGLAARLDDPFAVLTAGRRGTPARHRSLRAVLDWSWALLTPPERVVLRRLAVHPDGCPLPAAEDIAEEGAAEEGPGGAGFVDVLGRLVDRSLVEVAEGPDGPRYRLPEPVRSYGLERLREAGELDRVARRHLERQVALAERAAPALHGSGQRRWLRVLDAERAGLRAALETAVRLRSGGDATRLVTALTWYWCLRGRPAEGVAWFDRAREAGGNAGEQPRAAVLRAGLALLAGQDAGPADAAEAEAARIADPAARARARWFLAYARHRGGSPGDDVRDLLAGALAGCEAAGDRWGVAAARWLRADLERAAGRAAGAERTALAARELFEELGDAWGRRETAALLAALAEGRGDRAAAQRLHHEGPHAAGELTPWDGTACGCRSPAA